MTIRSSVQHPPAFRAARPAARPADEFQPTLGELAPDMLRCGLWGMALCGMGAKAGFLAHGAGTVLAAGAGGFLGSHPTMAGDERRARLTGLGIGLALGAGSGAAGWLLGKWGALGAMAAGAVLGAGAVLADR